MSLQALVPPSQTGRQHFYPRSGGADNWQQAAPSRRKERAILSGLWLLVIFTAITIGLRMLNLSALTAPPEESAASPLASAETANAIGSTSLAAAGSRGASSFDDPNLASVSEPSSIRPPAPLVPTEAPPRWVARQTLAIERPIAALPAASARQTSGNPVCADAWRAMQLCPGVK